ncbi:MAG TPA: hypothetical protein VJV39_25270 [Dongiaceae bacterium]|nr:hypothetical protein [Dongiaceae bacterium]
MLEAARRAMPPVRVRYRLVGTLQVNTTGCVGIDDFVPFETQLGKRR